MLFLVQAPYRQLVVGAHGDGGAEAVFHVLGSLLVELAAA
ncbi:MAG: hypothetical protein ACI8UD_003130, partial [Planctomycetota bacterium]